ncbi:hypothetical protein LR48_Vigan06g085200 [Vigna angularis]|uniref:Uncharacterized protein n=1 Tax=Phaseolus angularis TaxID=3914 RepID=A0A0L9US66_PHAAN|nr:hypothetical protein LR48_Vigan06g085200 [Vigna angularis]
MNIFCNEPEAPLGFPITHGFDDWRKMKIQRVAATRGGSGAVDEDEDIEGNNGGGSNDGGLADLERLGHLDAAWRWRFGASGGGSGGGGTATDREEVRAQGKKKMLGCGNEKVRARGIEKKMLSTRDREEDVEHE